MEATKEFFGYFFSSMWLFGCLLATGLILWKRLAALRRRKREEIVEAERALRIVNEQIAAAERREEEQRRLSNEIHPGGLPLGRSAH
jgi:uncharacterized membrane protein